MMNKVLERKQGIPITMCILYSTICKKVGIELEPVALPFHFMIRLPKVLKLSSLLLTTQLGWQKQRYLY